MITIGDFARLGRVSVRMLRHYDTIGLLQPAYVDPANGYRYYTASQLPVLNRIIALKDLGFTLEQVNSVLDERRDGEGLSDMLLARRVELRERITADIERLHRVEGRLRLIEREDGVAPGDVLLKRIAPVRAAEMTALAPSYAHEHINAAIEPLFSSLYRHTAEAGVSPAGPAFAYYENCLDGVIIHAALPVQSTVCSKDPFEVVDLPGFTAATTVHRGPVSELDTKFQWLARWMDEHGYRSAGHGREVYLHCPDDAPDQWVMELQEPVTLHGDEERDGMPDGLKPARRHTTLSGA
ncbi:DNA-binding transcriptional regulator, MerR family [Sinosporangium album]|uniref:DNA-binding transcriptional regulator, MerR family n=1 Tax=Sinosporangium album TaxID=504805 RepID=A0A1G8CNE7_9ACTN|nr:MerR family transcriptional regulator [Sinosporangium album]SDH46995.1 DNA-binding transcriptional regulator, MerR family [Sinosporangium album]